MTARIEAHSIKNGVMKRTRGENWLWADTRNPSVAYLLPHPHCSWETLQPECFAIVFTEQKETLFASANDKGHFRNVLLAVNPNIIIFETAPEEILELQKELISRFN